MGRTSRRRFDVYVASEVGEPFLLACAFFLLVFLMLQALRLAQFVLISRIPLSTVAVITGCMILSFSHYALPPAFLSSLVIGFSRLSSEGELVAMRALGIRPARLLLPCFAAGAIVSLATLGISLSLAPWAERTMTEILYGSAHVKALPLVPARAFVRDFEGFVMNVESVDPGSGEMSGVFIRDEREAGSPVVIVARTGRFHRAPAMPGSPGKVFLLLKSGRLHRTSAVGLVSEKLDFREYSILVRTEPEAFVLPEHPRFRSGRDLLEKMASAPSGSQDFRDLSAELWKRIFFSLSPLALVLAGCGLGTLPIRSSHASGGVIALGVAGAYWFLLLTCASISGKGGIPAFWAMQLPDWAALAAGALVFLRRR